MDDLELRRRARLIYVIRSGAGDLLHPPPLGRFVDRSRPHRQRHGAPKVRPPAPPLRRRGLAGHVLRGRSGAFDYGGRGLSLGADTLAGGMGMPADMWVKRASDRRVLLLCRLVSRRNAESSVGLHTGE
jgi:hypothetical protein